MIIKQIMQKLESTFEDFDSRKLEADIEWSKSRVQALKEFKANNKQSDFGGAFGWYGKLFEIAGGKTWYNLFSSNSQNSINEFLQKNAKARSEKRNAKIALKVQESGATSVTSGDIIFSNDGFDGVFILETNKGAKKLTINTILAGGYGVQCLHYRTLVKIGEIK